MTALVKDKSTNMQFTVLYLFNIAPSCILIPCMVIKIDGTGVEQFKNAQNYQLFKLPSIFFIVIIMPV